MNNKIFFDTETTGVDAFNDRIVEIAIVKTDDDLNVIDEFYSLINPTIPIPLEATEVHNISDEDVKTAPTFEEIANEIYEFIKDCDVAGYNSNRFDIPLLSSEFNRVGIEWDLTDRNIIDVYRIETKFHTNKLSDVYKRYTGSPLTIDKNYIQWFLKNDIPSDFKKILLKYT